jgi:phosphate-selective porin OprO/OprP
MRRFLLLAASAAFTALAILPAPAGQPLPDDAETKEPSEDSIFKELWRAPTLYRDKKADFWNEFRLVGRVHGDLLNVESNREDETEALVSKFRVGFKAKFFRRLGVHVEVDFDSENGNWDYERLTDAYLSWKFCDALTVIAGKQPVHFTLDGGTSSNELLTLERNQIWTNVWPVTEFFNGVRLSGERGNWQYTAAYFSGGNRGHEFGRYLGSNFGLVSVGYDFDHALRVPKALLRFDYVYNERTEAGESSRPYEHIGSLVFQLDEGRWGVSTDMTYASGHRAQGELWGVVVMPWYMLTDRLQAVVRCTFLKSNAEQGLRFEHFDELFARGDELREVYAGLNYYFCGHQLKLQTGLAYSDMSAGGNDRGHYREWSWTSGFRISW